MKKSDMRDRIAEVFEESDLEVAGWDPDKRSELVEMLVTALTKDSLTQTFDMEYDDEEFDEEDNYDDDLDQGN